ncbi:MAG: signal transduction histidine kinase [Actinomycetia bacterium]|nr:signal transduction histidine kinase [Actinomycetes bacterium]
MVVLAVLLGVLAVAAAVSAVVARRAVRERIDEATARLGEESRVRPGLEGSLDRLERATQTIALRIGTARADTARMAQALEVIPQGVVLCDASGIEVFRNQVAEAFVGARHAEVLVERAVHEALAGALAGTRHRRHLDVLGPPRRMLDIIAVPLYDDGPAGALAIIDDVSERNRLEAIRRDFVANISHELKTPVGALGVLAETIVAEEDPAVTRRLAERMTGEAHRVGRIIDDLLALSQIEAEEQKVREAVTVEAMVEEAVERMRSVADARRITISAVGVGRRHTLRGDRPQLVSAIANLLENACKYSDEGSTVEVSSAADGRWVEIAVRDEGIGIPTTDLERVFERFYRVDRARSRETGGTGLGLSIVRHIASNHGGEVRVTSAEGEGSTFTLRFPAGPGPVAVSDPDEPHREAETA